MKIVHENSTGKLCPRRLLSLLYLVLLYLVIPFRISGHGLSAVLPVTQAVYIYGYNYSMVVAEVINANRSQVAYSSFESADKGYWAYSGAPAGSSSDLARTGTKYYNVASGQIERTGLPAGRYILSYWANTDLAVTGTNYSLLKQSGGPAINGWNYYEKIISFSLDNSTLTLNGSAKVDELRLYPSEAQMTTWTYDPLIGKTSETDANNATVYYEYDEFNVLKNIKDQYGNIVKNYYQHSLYRP